MEVKYSETEHLLNALKAIANQSTNRAALRQQFVGDIIDKGKGTFKDVKINTYVKVLKDDLKTYKDALVSYFKEASMDEDEQPDDKYEEVAKWFLGCILESINESMFSILCELMKAVDIDYEKNVKANPDAIAETSKKAAKHFYELTKKDGFLQPWQDILEFEKSEGIQTEQTNKYIRILSVLSEVLAERYNLDAKETAKENSNSNYDALLNIYIEGLLKPVMEDLKAFSEAHSDPGMFTDSTKITDKLLLSTEHTVKDNRGKALLKNSDSDGYYRFYPESKIVKDWFNYLLGFEDKTPPIRDSDFKKEAQQFHDNLKHTYEAMDDGWGSISEDNTKDVSEVSAENATK